MLTPDDEAIETTAKQKRKRKYPGRTKLSPEFERQITEVLVPEDERASAHCGEAMCVIGYLEHEQVEYGPAKLIVHVDRREKLACRSCGDDATTGERQDPPVVPILKLRYATACAAGLRLYRDLEGRRHRPMALGCERTSRCRSSTPSTPGSTR